MSIRPTLVLLAALVSGTAMADAPWGQADPNQGKPLHDKSCIACHARMYGGDGSKMYTREKRLVSSKPELLQRVAACSVMAKTGWLPEEEGAVAAWLNQQYYKFDNKQ
ncbi:MAG TPA: cytochrome c [Rhodocyclaceae bacterium]|nr:cytochrome c [Rhodocyclaceae bacterium]